MTELQYIEDVLQSGRTSGDGKYTKMCEERIEELIHSNRVMMTTSCSHALEMACELIELDGFEVIMPSYNFPSSANAVLRCGGKVVFTEVCKRNLCMDVSRMEEKITIKTKAILVVHYGGACCDMRELMRIAEKYELLVIEDAAQSFLSTFEGKALGTFGDLGCFSFHETKNISCGEGGALSINRPNSQWIERAERIRQKGTNRAAFQRGDLAFYEWVDIGSSYCPSDILMAYLYSQLEKAKSIQEQRVKRYMEYYELFQENQYPSIEFFSQKIEKDSFNAHVFFIIFYDEGKAERFMEGAAAMGVSVLKHFVPLHKSSMGRSLGYHKGDFPFEEGIYNRMLRLPLSENMELNKIKNKIHNLLMEL